MSGKVFSGEAKLTKLLSDELELLEKVKKLTDEQTRKIEAEQFEDLESLLTERQGFIEKINGLHQKTDSLMQSYVSSSDYGTMCEIDNLREQIKQIFNTCKIQNERNVKVLRSKSAQYSEKIDKQSAQRKGIGGYAQAVPNKPERFDKKT